MKRLLIAALFIVGVTACTDADMGHLKAYGGTGHVVCYSGNLKIYDGESTGKIQNDAGGSDGYEFVDKADHKLTQVSGNCVVKYENY